MGTIKVQNITAVRPGVWLIVYMYECECGCTKKRYNFTHNQKVKPTDNKAKQLADADYNSKQG